VGGWLLTYFLKVDIYMTKLYINSNLKKKKKSWDNYNHGDNFSFENQFGIQ
jgi:hypothetical protein